MPLAIAFAYCLLPKKIYNEYNRNEPNAKSLAPEK